jgi:hypothetical protein
MPVLPLALPNLVPDQDPAPAAVMSEKSKFVSVVEAAVTVLAVLYVSLRSTPLCEALDPEHINDVEIVMSEFKSK